MVKMGPGVETRKKFDELTTERAKYERLESLLEHLQDVARREGKDPLFLLNTLGKRFVYRY